MAQDKNCDQLREMGQLIADLREHDSKVYELEVHELENRRKQWIASEDQPNVDTPTLFRLMNEQQAVVTRHKEAIIGKTARVTTLLEQAIAACHCH